MQYKGIVRKLTHELMDTGKTYVGKSARVLAKPACAALIAGGLLVSSGIGYHRDYAEAQTPTPYSQNVNVDGHTVSGRMQALYQQTLIGSAMILFRWLTTLQL